ncbi:hypothetical protein WR25_12327 [Diploscapter pachys]|uniref:Prolyl 4-hydroxylase alpha subunit Fe(2+) 2OG dioxygenase domain-containing protein n=1 Tax=Diploscapter pachys TaxID=2018661 RepID=A0A2A2LBC0_9BILA|nr:hypothetical protein WR25_12327 [Diploscapter pachys]
MEVLSWHPFLIVLREFVSQVQINRFLDDIFVKRLEEQKVVDENDASGGRYHISRKANGTEFKHRETLGTSQMYEYTTNMLPYINFEVSELWQEEDALHGACPIKKGEKIAATLWIRQHDQLFDYYCAGFPPKNFADRIINPLYFMTQS